MLLNKNEESFRFPEEKPDVFVGFSQLLPLNVWHI